MRYKVTLSYDGSHYGGWQKQLNSNSIQEQIEEALQTIENKEVIITASGRTDAGVHAIGQVFHFDATKDIACDNWRYALNSLLPSDIRIQLVEEVSGEFHARFDAVHKRYDFLITSDVNNPFVENYMAKDTRVLDVEYMRDCAQIFIGTHDFTSFTSNKIDPRKSRIKTIDRIELQQEGKCIRMIFEGNGFLRYMVRMLSQTLVEAGKKRITKADIQEMLDAKDKHVCHYKAAAQGLYLINVEYKDKIDH